jgi:putative addiction module component (TIGR02574 family)
MSMTRDQIFAEAQSLDPKDRELLAEDLWQSLDETTRNEVNEAWAVEIQRRLQLLDSGQMGTTEAPDVFAKLRAKIDP